MIKNTETCPALQDSSTLRYLQNMLMITQFKVKYNSKTKIYTVKVEQISYCPLCGGDLSVRDSRKRGVIDSGGEKKTFKLRRLKCGSCDKLHIELPDIIQPFKHYAADVIESALDGTDYCPAETSTIKRWRKWFSAAVPYIERVLAAIKLTNLSNSINLLKYSSLIDHIRAGGRGWLRRLTQMLVNSGGRLAAEG